MTFSSLRFWGRVSRSHVAGAVLIVVLVMNALHDCNLLFRFPVAAGVDGYYYIKQIETLLTAGRFYFPTGTPLVLYLLAGISYLVNDPILGVKIGSIALHMLLGAGLYAIIASVTKSLWLGVLASTLAALSGLHLYLVAEFINQLGAITCLVWAGWFAIRALETGRAIYAGAAFICLTLAAFSHRSALPIALLIVSSTLLARQLINSISKRQHLWITSLLILALWLLPAIIAATPLAPTSGWLKGELSTAPQWPVGRYALAEALILFIVSPATLFLLARSRPTSERTIFVYLFGGMALLSLLVTLNPFLQSPDGWLSVVQRLRALAYIQVALLVPGLLWIISTKQVRLIPYALALIVPFAVLSHLGPLPFGLRPEYLLYREKLIEHLRLSRQQIDSSAIVIAPHGDQFVVSAVLDLQAQQRLPSDTQQRALYWLVRGVRCDHAGAAIILTTERPDRCTLLSDSGQLQQIWTALPEADRQQLFALNPTLRQAQLR